MQAFSDVLANIHEIHERIQSNHWDWTLRDRGFGFDFVTRFLDQLQAERELCVCTESALFTHLLTGH